MLSIIIPVYNTEKYLHKCFDSILCQDYKDYEIIAINDGSTDGSLDVLEEYARKDSRVRIINKQNEGQGIARNIAIEQANGDILYFIDSDDWITDGSLRAMVDRLNLTDADVVVGNSAVTYTDSEEIKRYNNEKISGVIYKEDIKYHVFEISGCTCPKMIKKKLFLDYDIRFPGIYFEDLATLPRIYAMAERIAFSAKCVYVQRNNSMSTVHRQDLIYDRIRFVDYLIEGFKELGIYDEYEQIIKDYLVKRGQINLRMVRSLGNKMYLDFAEAQRDIWKEKYGISTIYKKNSYCYGSYNLMIWTKIFMGLEDSATVETYFGGSSLISCMGRENKCLNDINVSHRNDFRRRMLINDFERRFMKMNAANFYDYDYFFVDFLEERFDIGVYKGEYFTLSQAFYDIREKVDISYDVIQAFSSEWWSLWKDSCKRFINKLGVLVEDKPVILVKSYLAEKKYDDEGESFFENIDEIRTINNELEKCYDFFANHCRNAQVIEIRQMEEYITDSSFRHGCYPWHLSDFAYGKISSYIESEIERKLNGKS